MWKNSLTFINMIRWIHSLSYGDFRDYMDIFHFFPFLTIPSFNLLSQYVFFDRKTSCENKICNTFEKQLLLANSRF